MIARKCKTGLEYCFQNSPPIRHPIIMALRRSEAHSLTGKASSQILKPSMKFSCCDKTLHEDTVYSINAFVQLYSSDILGIATTLKLLQFLLEGNNITTTYKLVYQEGNTLVATKYNSNIWRLYYYKHCTFIDVPNKIKKRIAHINF